MDDDQFFRIVDVVLIIVFPTCFLLFNVGYWYYYFSSNELVCVHSFW